MKYFDTFTGIGGFTLAINQAYETIRNIDVQKVGGGEIIEEGIIKEGQGLHTISSETTLPVENRNNELPDTSTDERQPHCVGYSEIDKYASSIYQKHYQEHKNYGDIKSIDWESVEDFDLFTGGFPCQAFSIAGKRKGFEDTRGTLFFDIAKGLKIKQPSFAVLENVKGLVSHDGGNTLETILLALQELGYYVNIEIYNSKDFGVPQNRERIIFICKHIKTIIKDGHHLNLNISKQIITEYLFQILLNNLTEVQKLQGEKSKDWVLGYLLLKEIYQNQTDINQKDNTRGGITTLMEESKSMSEESLWQSIDTLLNNTSEENLNEQNKSTTSMEIKKIIDSKIYTFSQMQKVILLLTGHLRQSQKNLWKEILSDLIVIKENTKYARINDKKEEVIITESGNVYLTSDIQKNEQHFIVGHLRGTSRPQVFPIGTQPVEDTRRTGQEVSYTIDANYAKGTNTIEKSRRQVVYNQYDNRVMDKTCGTIGTCNTRTSKQGFMVSDMQSVRRLTPLECERLQGFPDNWTEGISDTQRYKCCGNAVTVNVVQAILEKLL